MTPHRAAVSVRDLRKTYGAFEALRGVDFDIEEGETFALLGPNGAGKSTTIEILEGYRDRSGGTAEVLGVDPQHGGTEWKARLGIVLQSGIEAADVTVREQLVHFSRFYPQRRDVDELIAAVGLTDKAKTRIRNLSGGQRRRLDVALGVIGRPELLFLDEPTTGFDPEARHQFWDLIRDLKREGTTILLTTHYLDEAAQLSDRVAVIARGTQLFAVEDFERSLRAMSLSQQEAEVAKAVAQAGVTVSQADGGARRACAEGQSAGLRQPSFVMRYTTADLGQIPEQLRSQLRTGNYTSAVVAACPAQDSGDFSMYRLAVLLYRARSN